MRIKMAAVGLVLGLSTVVGSAAAQVVKGHLTLILRGDTPIPPRSLGEIEDVQFFYGREAGGDGLSFFIKVVTKTGKCTLDSKTFRHLAAIHRMLLRSPNADVKCYSQNQRDKPDLTELRTDTFKIVTHR
jgi:hypothetical protein